jgi:hypothetical protein
MIEIIGRPNEPAQFLTTSKIAWVGNLSEINSGPWHGSNISWIRGRCLRYSNAPIAARLDFLRDFQKSAVLAVTDLNDFDGPTRTTNLGYRSSNLFVRHLSKCAVTPRP